MRRTRLSVLMLGLLCGVGAPAAGCGDGETRFSPRMTRCLDHCEAAKSCPSADPRAQAVSCYTLCDDADAVNGVADCYDESDALYACIDRHGICDSEIACASWSDAYADCIAEHCSPDPDRDECGIQ